MSKIYIGLITSNGNSQHLQWYKGISQYVDGIAAVFHGEKDEGYEILNRNKGDGFVVCREFYGHHSHSMNDFLLNPKIRPGDWIILRDTLEQLNINFLKNIRHFMAQLEMQNVNSVFQYSKLLMFKKFEHQMFQSSPHWGLQKPHPNYLEIDKQPGFENPKDYAFSIRNDIREPSHFIDHFVRYYLYDSSNHLLLGRENDNQDFQLHEEVRYKFKKYCNEELKMDISVNNLKKYIMNNELSYQSKFYFNFEPILNDFYCFHKLNHSVESILQRHAKKETFKIV